MTAAPRATPPSRAELSRALERLFSAELPDAAVHLVLPVGEVPGIDARGAGGRWSWRGHEADLEHDVLGGVLELVEAGLREEDQFLDLTDAEQLHWLKPVRSGARCILFGTDYLLGGPLVAFDSDVPPEAAVEVVRRWQRGRPLGHQVITSTGVVEVGGDERSLVLHRPLQGREGPPADHEACAREAGEEIAATLGALVSEVVELGSRVAGSWDAEVICELEDGWEAIVPVTLTGTTSLPGVDRNHVRDAPEEELPAGYRWLGRSQWEDAAVAEHESGLAVLLRKLD